MPLVYNICDIAVLPSICDEAAGLTIIEAMACEKVVITTDAGGITEYTDTDSSIILERDKQLSKNIAENVDDLLSNKGKMISMGKNGRNKVQKYFDSKSYINNFISVIKDYF